MPPLLLISVKSVTTQLTQLIGSENWLAEHGPLENLQTLLLLFSSVVFLVRLPFAEKQARTFLAGCALFCLTCTVREVDIEQLAIHPILITLGSGMGRNILFTTIWLGLGLACWPHRSELWNYSRSVIGSTAGVSFFLAATFVVFGGVMDRSLIMTANNLLWEESLELVGLLLAQSGSSPNQRGPIAKTDTNQSRKVSSGSNNLRPKKLSSLAIIRSDSPFSVVPDPW